MKRLGLCGLIIFGILTHFLAAFQSPAQSAEEAQSYIVLLKEPSVVEKSLEWSPGGSAELRRWILDSPEARRYEQLIGEHQMQFLNEFFRAQVEEGILSSLEVLDRRTFLLNMLVVRAHHEEIERLRQQEEVDGVYPNHKRYLLLDTAPLVVGAPALWEPLGGIDKAGQGIKIGIIDSGINQDHPMFSADGFNTPAGFPLGDSAFANSKVIVARTYVKPEYGLKQQDNDTPQDELGHGSQVAAIAAGRVVDTPQGPIQGIAPMAFLGNYKVFGSPSKNPNTTVAAVTKAIEDAVEDGMEVINLSLGGEARNPAVDPEQKAIALAVEAAVVVVVAAGNGGPNPRTITSPGTSPDAVTVGATSNGRIFASALDITSDSPVPAELQTVPYVPGTGRASSEPVGPLPIVSIALLDTTELACQPLPAGSLSGEAALIRRGECFFSAKAKNVFDAGAEAMVVYNNVTGSAIVMGGLNDVEPPAVMIKKAAGEALRDFLIGGAEANVTFRAATDLSPFPAQADIMTSFSSRGPNIDLAIKPDLTAPGDNIHTASNRITPEPQYSLRSSGTSFAAPMVSGAAALVKQLHPDWQDQLSGGNLARAIKSVLVNTAAKTTTWKEEPARLIHTGNGRLDLTRAAKASAVLDPVSLSFGLLSEDISSRLERRIKLTNLSSNAQTFQIELSHIVENPSVQMSISPLTLALSPGEIGEFTISADSISPLAAGVFEGFARISSSEEGTELTASYWGGVTVEDDSLILRVSQNDQTAHASIASAIEAAQPGNVIEVADSSTYREVIDMTYNTDGLTLNGITLRSAPGESPTIDVRELTSQSPAVTVSDLERVTVEGMRINGGLHGIRYSNASGTVRNNTIEGTSANAGSYGIQLAGSRVHVFANTIRNNNNGIAAFSSSALIQHNQIGGMAEGNGNQGTGIFVSAGSPVGIYENEISNLSSLNGKGIHIFNAVALIKGNTILNTQENMADGILAQGQASQLSVLDNQIEGNGRFGISLISGAQAFLERNQLLKNQSAGLHLEEGSTATIHSSSFLENGTGIRSFSSSAELFDSLIAGSTDPAEGDGIFAAEGVLRAYNSTIFGNAGFGIRLSGTQTTVSNSILDQNTGGELSGASSNSFSNNLIGDGQFAGLDGNFAADPMFSNPLNLDFSLREGSPAIDRGSQFFPISSLDLLSHERVIDGNKDDIAGVDLGAIEFGSEFWVPRILPVLSVKEAEFVGLAMANGFHESTRVLLRAYKVNGQLSGTFELEIPPGQQVALLLTEAFNPLQEGWIEILSSKPDLMSFTLLGNQSLSFLDGAELSSALSDKLLFPEIRSQGDEETRFYLINPHPQGVDVSLRWIRSDGSSLDKIYPIAARGMLALTFAEIFGGGTGGYITATVPTGEPICGMEIFGSPDSRGGLLALDYKAGSSQLFAAQLASGANIETTLNIINTGPVTDVTLEFLDENGESIKSFVLNDLPTGRQFRQRARDIFALPSNLVVGWLRIQSSTGMLVGNISFGDPAGKFLAAVPLQSQGVREFIFSHVVQTSEVFSGAALLNASSDNALVSVEVFDSGGERTGISFLQLASGQKWARLFTELIPNLKTQTGGLVRIRSNVPIFGFEIFGSYSLNFMSAVPPQALVR
ncbi:S8 family serine peptidase [Acidobacteria bacterium AH-259-O06]|nr:S8 family serine peptidase [Acidobacteria bacterium AH-259-O06]